MSFSTYDDDEVIGDAPGFDTGDDDEEVTGPVASIYKTAYSRGVNPDFLIGLAKLETRMGEASIKGDSDSYNLFNIKDMTGKGPRAIDRVEGSRDAYRQYASYDDSANDLVDMLARKYPKALEAQTPEQFATALKQGGYATDPDYVNKVVRTINSVKRYDQPATDDAPEGMPNHVNLRALDAQMSERSAQAAPPTKAPAERTWREAATDTARSLTQGAIDVVGVLPGVAWAATPWGSYDNAWLNTARGMNEVIQDQKSDEIKARRVEMDKKLSNAEGFTQKIVAGFVEGLADPTLLADTLARSAPGMVAGGFAGKAAGTAADALGMTVLKNAATQSGVISQGLTVASAAPRVAGATAVGTSAIVQGSSVASDTYEEAMKRPMSDFRALPEFEQLAQEHGEEQAKSILAGKAATRAGMVATAASLVAQKAIPGGDSIEKMFLPSTMREVADTVVKTGAITKGMAGGAASQAAELALQGTKTGLKEGFSEGFEESAGKVAQDLEMSRVGKDVNLSDTVASTFGQAAAVGMAAGSVSRMPETYATKAESIAAEGARLREMAAKRQADITKAGTVDEAIKAATDAQDYTSQSIANQILQLEGKQGETTRITPQAELPSFTSQPQPAKLATEATAEAVQPGPTFDAPNLPIIQQERLANGTQADQTIQSKPQEAPAETAGIKAEAAAQAQAAQDAGIRAEVARMREIMEARRQAEQAIPDPAQAGTVVPDLPNTSAAKQTTATTGIPVVETPVKDLKLSTDVPQFKSDAGANGVVDKLDGKYDRALAAPIQVWQRTDGSMEVISGRHRLDLAQRSGEQTVPVQVHREADGFTAAHATLLDTELNVKDGRGKVKDYVRYFQSIPIERGEATQRGLLQTAIGRDAYTIANAGSDELIASHNASQLTDQAATQIAQAAPKNGALQAVGIRMVLDGKSTTQAVNTMAAVKLMAQERGGAETEDMFGFDDSSMRDAQAMAKIAGQEQAKVSNTLAAVRGAAKRPELAAKEGVNINDQTALAGRIQSLEKQKSEWSNWATNPELVAQIRSKMEPQGKQQPARTEAPAQQEPAFDLTPTTPEQVKADEERAASASKAEAMAKQNADNRAQADAEVDDFRLTGSDRAADVAEAAGQGSLFDAPTIEAAHAHIDSDATLNTLEKAKARAALRKGDIEPGDILPKAQEAAAAPTQEVNDVDQNQGAMFSKDATAPTEPPLTTRQTVRDAIAESLPKQARAIDRMIQRGETGKRGGMVVIESNTPEAIAKAYSEKTGHDYDAALASIRQSIRGKNEGMANQNDVVGNKGGRSADDSTHSASSKRFPEGNRLSNLSIQGPSWQRIRENNPVLRGKSPNDTITVYRATIGNEIRHDDFVAVDKSTLFDELENVRDRDGEAAKIISQKVRVRDLLMGNDATEFVFFPENESTAPAIDGAQLRLSKDGKIQGFHDTQSGLTFVVAPNVTARTAAAVALHEAYHGQQRDAIDTKAQALLDSADDKLHTKGTREVLAEARQKIADAGETENKGEAAAYIIEAAAQRGREAGFSAVDGKFMDWVDKHIGQRVGGIIRDFVSMVRAHSLRIGLPINLHVDDLVAYAKIGLERAAEGKTVDGDGVMRSEKDTSIFSTPAFKKWFGDSKVVDSDGKPMVMYHGTKADFSKFDLSKFGTTDGGWLGKAFYFTPAPMEASLYAEAVSSPYGTSTGANVMPVYLTAKNPLEWKLGTKESDIFGDKRRELGADGFVKWAKDQGYDAVHLTSNDIGKTPGENQWAVFSPEQIKSATGNNGEFDGKNPDIRFSFAGRKAATADTNAMQTAQERIKRGDDAEDVRNETGWFKGVDGKMRFEINDKDAKLIVKQGDYVGIDAKKNEAGTWGVVKLGALLDHPAMFAAYPSLKDMDVTLKSYGGGGGHYGTDGSIILNGAIAKRPIATATDGPFPVSKADADAINAEEAKLGDWRLKDKGTTLSVLLHEIQHGIQHIEGFASGGSYKQFEQKQAAALPLETVSRAIDIQEFASKNNLSVQQVKDSPPRYLRNVGADAWQLASSRNKASLEAEYEFSKRADDPQGSYHRLAGEVEARNVQTRQKFTDEERALMPAYTTQDVPDRDVIVMFNGKEMHSAPPPANTPPAQQQPAAPASPTWDYEGSKADKLIYELQDGRIDLKRVQESIKRSGQDIDEKFDARLAETLYAGRVATRTDRFLQDDAAPLLEQMARSKVTMPELSDYLQARYAPERNAQIAKVNDATFASEGAGKNSKGMLMTTQNAKDYIANLPTETRLKMEALAKKVDAITKGTRDLLVAEGLEKQETIDAWEATYKNYVPLFREDVDDGRPHSVGTGFSVRGDSSKRATGSDKKVDNMLAHVLMQREAAITRAEKNRVAMSLYGLALSSPNKDFWTTIKPDVSHAQVQKIFADMGIDYDALPGAVRALVYKDAKTEARKQELDSIGVDRDKESNMSLAPTIAKIDRVTGKVVHVTNPIYKSLPGAISVRINGEDRILLLNQKDENALRLAESLKNLDGLTKFDLAGTIVGKTTRWISAANTQYNPAFGLVNSTRDSLGALVNLSTTPIKGKQLQVFGNMPSATAGIYSALRGDTSGKWAKLYEQFQMDGGQTGYKEMFKDVDARAKAIEKQLAGYDKGALSPGKAAHAVLSVLDGFNTIGENVVRLSAYKTALDNGLSRPEAAKLARELTVDFNRKGRMGRELGPLYAFFNASVQGTARTLESLKGPAGAKIIAGGIGVGVLQALLFAIADYDDDEVADWTKSRTFVVPLGKTREGEKKHLLIPLPLGLNALPNIGRTMVELGRSGGKDFGKKTVSAIGEVMASLNPVGGGTVFTPEGGIDWGGVAKTAVPTILDPVVELATNKGFSGTAIEKTYRGEADNRPGFQRAKEKTKRTPTGQMYLGITKALNRATGGDDYEAGFISPSPEKARYLAEAIGGGLLREIEKAVDLSMKVPGQKETKVSGIPFIGRFYGETDSDAVAQSRYYKSADKAKSAESSINLAKAAGDGEAMKRIYEKLPEAKSIDLMNRVQPKLAELNKLAVSQLNDSENIKLIDDARLKWMKATNKAILELEAQ